MAQLAIDFDALPRFNGSDYDHHRDAPRLTGQIQRIYALMQDSEWRTLREIAQATGDPEASVSAQLRHLRKARFGAHTVEKRNRGEPANGLYEYRVLTTDEMRRLAAMKPGTVLDYTTGERIDACELDRRFPPEERSECL